MDKDKDGIDDKIERIMEYILVAIILSISAPALYMELISGTDFKWIVIIVTGIVVGFNTIKQLIKKGF